MSQNIFEELNFLLYAVLLGAFLAAVYDLFRILRRVFAHKDLMVSLEDLMFWLFCAVGVFYLLNAQSDGRLRWFSVLGAAIGMNVYRATLSRLLVPVCVWCVDKCRRAVQFLVHYLVLPVRAAGHQGRRAGQRSYRYVKKKLTVTKKKLRMILCKQ